MADNKHKTMIGRVMSARMNKTCIVGVEKQKEHPLYRKTYRVTVKYKVHDEKNEARVAFRKVEDDPEALARWLRLEGFYAFTRQDSQVTGGEIHRHRTGVQIVISQPVRIR